ncbi:LuxR C-terminal-related transcriptional regulator [Pseudomonas sp.]|uniref:helix-turn-helix transcriptional regulator n=1 Tax=Pseudomonas sp. TaxID=306 RepID=UPI0025901099|nr:LuxR C-terminal-related transcriptional regulator [Pseudomonas sp.]
MESTIVNGSWQGRLGLGLAPKELQYLLSVAQGMTAKEIGKVFGVSPQVVTNRLQVAMYKLDVNRSAALVAEAMRRNIISPLCLMLASLLAFHAVSDDETMRRDRKIPEPRRGGYEIKIARKGFEKVRPGMVIG